MDPQQAIMMLFDYGLFDVWLPFALILIVVSVGLSRVSYLNKKMRTIIGICVAAMTVYMHVAGDYMSCLDPVRIIGDAVPTLGYVSIGLLIFFFVIGIVGLNMGFVSKILGWGVIVMIAVTAYAGLSAGGLDCLPFNLTSIPFIEFIVAFLIFLFGGMFMTGKRRTIGIGSDDDDMY